MRHRKVVDDTARPSRPLFCATLDLVIEFMLSNLRKTLPVELHALALGVVHRILCYQKKCGIRINYPWTDLWSAMITLLKFLINNESDLLKKFNVFALAANVCNQVRKKGRKFNTPADYELAVQINSPIRIQQFNLFITFGDTFLPSEHAYDQLYYEIIRNRIVFENLYSLGEFIFAFDT